MQFAEIWKFSIKCLLPMWFFFLLLSFNCENLNTINILQQDGVWTTEPVSTLKILRWQMKKLHFQLWNFKKSSYLPVNVASVCLGNVAELVHHTSSDRTTLCCYIRQAEPVQTSRLVLMWTKTCVITVSPSPNPSTMTISTNFSQVFSNSLSLSKMRGLQVSCKTVIFFLCSTIQLFIEQEQIYSGRTVVVWVGRRLNPGTSVLSKASLPPMLRIYSTGVGTSLVMREVAC